MPLEQNRIDDLVESTKAIWNAGAKERIDRYIEELLPEEIQAARDDDPTRLPGEDDSRDLLIMMLGFSVEPLLQTIIAYRPKRVLLVHAPSYRETNREVPGQEKSDQFKNLVARLQDSFRDFNEPEYLIPPPDMINGAASSMEVFATIRRVVVPLLLEDPSLRARTLIDITGAKKSMVTGAYLFATFARVDVSYVDFDRYDPDYQRPYGFSCRIHTLESPAEGYHLDAWRRAHQQYETAAYGALTETLREILGQMHDAPGLFLDPEQTAAQKLRAMACSYARWAEGDYRGARDAWEVLGLAQDLLPEAVPMLADRWPEALADTKIPDALIRLERGTESERDMPKHAESLFGKTDLFFVYACDEIEKIDRLIRHTDDYRSALLRAAGLNETVLKLGVVRLWLERAKAIELSVQSGVNSRGEPKYQPIGHEELDEHRRNAFERRVAMAHGASRMANFLGRKRRWLNLNPLARDSGDELPDTALRMRRRQSVGLVEPGNQPLSAHNLAEIRNKAIHFTVPVGRDLARDALELVHATVTAVAGESSSLPDLRFTPPWTDLCRACGIDFLPPEEDESHG